MTSISVLYVDDEPGLLEIGKLFLEQKKQFSVDTITSAPAALALLKLKNYDAIISDYQMPEMDGIEFLKKVRSQGSTIPFILFTGRGREEVIIRALNEGADFYLQKGGESVSQFTELAHQIRQAVQKRRAEASIHDFERRESDIINFQPDATVAIDRSGHIIAWNRAMEEVTGVSAAEMLGKGDYEYAIPFYGQRQSTLIDLIFESDEIIAEKYAHIIHKNNTLIADAIFPTLKGKSVTFMAMASPFYNRQGEVTGAIESIRDITDRNLAEEALRESEERYRRIVETTDEGICQMNEQFETVYVNRRMADMLGYTPEEIVGQNIASFMVAEDMPDHTTRREERRQEQNSQYERRFVTKDGRIRWIQVSGTPILDPDGTFRGSFAMCSDITDRKATEEKLRQNYDKLTKNQNLLLEREKQYRLIVETAKEGILQVDEKFDTVYVNQQMADMLGYTPEEMMGRHQTSFVAKEDRPEQITRFEECRQGKSGRFERRFITKDGRIRWMQVSATPLLNPDGTFRGSFGMCSDITDRKTAEEGIACRNQELRAAYEQLSEIEEELRQNYDELAKSQDLLIESEKQYRQIVETTNEGICKLDEKLEIVYVNRRMAEMHGLTPEEMMGQNITHFMVAEDIPINTSRIKERRLGKSSQYERRFVTKDGKIRWMQVSSTPLFDPDGTFQGSFAMYSDITDRKTAEGEIACRNQELRAAYEQLSEIEEELRQNYDELAKSQNLLIESEKQYRQIVETTDEGICKLDEKFEMVYVNRRMAEMHGLTPEEMMGQNITHFMVAEDIPINTSRIKERRLGKSSQYERRFVTKDGKIRWMQVSSTPLFDPDGTFQGSFAMYSDITDRKAAEKEIVCRNQELRLAYEQLSATEEELKQNYDELAKSQDLLLESENQYRQIVETTDDGIWKLDKKFETVYINRRMADMLGYTPEEMMGQSYTSFVAAEDVSVNASRVKELRLGKSSRYERRFVTKDGRIRWMQVSSTPLFDPDGTFQGSFAMYSDITDRKAAEGEIASRNQELRLAYEQLSASEEELKQNYDELAKSQNLLLESEKQYRQIVETTDDGICQLDEKYETIYVNRRMADMLGYTPEEMMGRSYTSFMAAEDVPDQTTRLEERRQGKNSRYERRFVTKDGNVRWIYVSATPILDPDGTFRGSFAMHSDITDRKAAEEGIVRRNEKLHATNKQLSAAEEKLQRNYDKLVKSQRMLAEAMDLANLVNWECNLNTGILTFDDRFSTLYGTNPNHKGIQHMTAEAYLKDIVYPDDRGILAEEDEKTRNTTDPHYVSKREYRIIREDGGIRHIEMCVGVTKDAKGRTIKTHGVNQDITERKVAEEALRESEEKFRSFVENAIDIMYSITPDGIFTYVSPQCTELLGYETSEFIGKSAAAFVHPEDFPCIREAIRQTIMTGEKKSGLEFRMRHKNGTWRWYATTESPVHDAGGKVVAIQGICHDVTERKSAGDALRLANHRLNLLGSITRHDINNKITASLGYLKLAEMKSSDPTIGAYLGKMESAITEIQSQIGFTRIYQDLGTKEPQWIAVDTVMPRTYVPATVTLNAELLGVEVFADPMLEKVFFNLLDNSIRHGEHVTEIRVSSQKSGGDLLVVWEDNGIGVAADEKERIFERGFGRNTGLGMFLVREILSLTNITIKETGEPGKGARFEICVPNGNYRFNPECREKIALKESS
ncbi:PAS domain S-box protein [Methanoregula sp.]|uniref:hybrid sensor histidine kinase/response regulator n=1 Tax=Methanoregula sp. TaxID=2052170 RepID=UPI003563E537